MKIISARGALVVGACLLALAAPAYATGGDGTQTQSSPGFDANTAAKPQLDRAREYLHLPLEIPRSGEHALWWSTNVMNPAAFVFLNHQLLKFTLKADGRVEKVHVAGLPAEDWARAASVDLSDARNAKIDQLSDLVALPNGRVFFIESTTDHSFLRRKLWMINPDKSMWDLGGFVSPGTLAARDTTVYVQDGGDLRDETTGTLKMVRPGEMPQTIRGDSRFSDPWFITVRNNFLYVVNKAKQDPCGKLIERLNLDDPSAPFETVFDGDQAGKLREGTVYLDNAGGVFLADQTCHSTVRNIRRIPVGGNTPEPFAHLPWDREKFRNIIARIPDVTPNRRAQQLLEDLLFFYNDTWEETGKGAFDSGSMFLDVAPREGFPSAGDVVKAIAAKDDSATKLLRELELQATDSKPRADGRSVGAVKLRARLMLAHLRRLAGTEPTIAALLAANVPVDLSSEPVDESWTKPRDPDDFLAAAKAWRAAHV